jgi:hypothetical protein
MDELFLDDIYISFDRKPFRYKPKKIEMGGINNRVGANPQCCSLDEFADAVGNRGHAFSGVIFQQDNISPNDKSNRSSKYFLQQGVYALDFDNTISFEAVKARLDKLGLDLAFAYDTLTSINRNKFRVVFIHNQIVYDIDIAKIIINSLLVLFPEADPICKDPGHIFNGGKELFYYDSYYKPFCLFHLIEHVCSHFRDLKKNHDKRSIQKFCLDNKIAITENGLPCIQLEGEMSWTEYKNFDSGILTEGLVKILLVYNRPSIFLPSTYYSITLNKGNKLKKPLKQPTRTKPYNTSIFCDETKFKTNLIKDYSFEEQYRKCRLYKEFVDGIYLNYNQRYGILLNMIQLSGGEKRFLEILYSPANEQHPSYQEKDWKYTCEYSRKQGYNAKNCNNFCPYYEECQHAANIILTVKNFKNQITLKENHPDNVTVSLSEAEKDLKEKFNEAINSNDNCIHLLLAQTGIGKSEIYINYIRNASDKYLIVVPTIDLKHDITKRINDLGGNARAYPSFRDYADQKLIEEIDSMYSIGANKIAHLKILKAAETDQNIKDYLDAKKDIEAFDGHIVTTHKSLTVLEKDYVEKFIVLIDEDIFSTIFEIKSVSKSNLEYLRMRLIKNRYKLDNENYKAAKERLDYLLDDLNEDKEEVMTPLKVNIQPIISSIVLTPNHPINTNIVDFFKASAVYLDKHRMLHYVVRNELSSQKIVILSATADPELYKKCYGIDSVKIYKCKNANYKGHIIQIDDESFSRRHLSENKIIMDELNTLCKDYPLITFKGLKSLLGSTSELHFGKTEGFNSYEGSDIVIIGTPFQTDIQYKLYAAALGHIASGSDSQMRHQPVDWRCFKFSFMTYADPLLRHIQFWMINTGLEQAIGRARLLRNDCTTYVFSSFPLHQATRITYKEFCASKNFKSSYTGRKKINAIRSIDFENENY